MEGSSKKLDKNYFQVSAAKTGKSCRITDDTLFDNNVAQSIDAIRQQGQKVLGSRVSRCSRGVTVKNAKLADMVRGWFIGNFGPTLYKTNDVEIAVKEYKQDDYEDWHYHKIATEFTVIISGRVKMNRAEYGPGEIIVIEPNEGTDFLALTDVVNVVVKIPGASNDKYLRGTQHA
jgi:mannose-6-phosphate isomerase-like protein (cupin superfamily)